MVAGGEWHLIEADGWQVTAETKSLGFYVEDITSSQYIALYRNWEWVREQRG